MGKSSQGEGDGFGRFRGVGKVGRCWEVWVLNFHYCPNFGRVGWLTIVSEVFDGEHNTLASFLFSLFFSSFPPLHFNLLIIHSIL